MKTTSLYGKLATALALALAPAAASAQTTNFRNLPAVRLPQPATPAPAPSPVVKNAPRSIVLPQPTVFNARSPRLAAAVTNRSGGSNGPVPSNGQAASLTTSAGAIGSRIGIAIQPNLAAPVRLIFSTGGIVPANISSGILRDNGGFYTPVPQQLCFSNVQNWVAKLQLADGTLLDPIGRFARPSNCP